MYKNIEIRSDERQELKTIARRENLREVLSKSEGSSVRVVRHKTKTEDAPEAKMERKKEILEVSLPDTSEIAVKKSNRQLAATILAIFEVAMAERNPTNRKEKFRILLFDLLKKW